MDTKKSDEKNILPFIEGLIFPMAMINSHLKDFFKLTGCAACITSLITILIGRSNYCGMNQGLDTFYCPFNSYAIYFVPISFLLVFLVSGFVYNKWQLIFSKNMSFLASIKEKAYIKDLKASGYLLLYLLFWGVLGIGMFLLDRRVPNPNWIIELMFFMLVSLSILLAVILLFNFVVFQHSLNGGKVFLINKTFLPIFDSMYKLMFWFLIYFVIFIYLLKMAMLVFADKSFPVWFNLLFGEISFYFVVYSMITVFSATLFYQEKALFREEK